MKRFLTVLMTFTLLLTAFVGWGQVTVSYDFSDAGAVTGLNELSPGIALDANVGFGSFQNSGTTNPAIVSSQLRLYQNSTKGGSIKIYASNGVTITSVVVYASGTTGPAAYSVDGIGSTPLTISSGAYTMGSLSASSEVEFWCTGSSSSTRIYVDYFEVTYTVASASPTVGFTTATSSVTEGNSGTTVHNVAVSMNVAPVSDVEVAVNSSQTSPVEASEGVDYTAVFGANLTFPANGVYPMTQNIAVSITGDVITEPNEKFNLYLTINGGTADLGTDLHVVTISNDDIPTVADIRINEVDADQTGNDSQEFIELYSEGMANYPLDGLVLVLFDGSSDESYLAFDLDGYETDGNGYFIVGSIADAEISVSPGSTGWLQNGADAVALYYANASDFSNGTAPTTTNLIDALVYDTSDPDDSGLLNGLGQLEQINENINSLATTQSIQRGSWFVATPTPRAVNLPVSLIKFSATQVAATAVLTFSTATEQNNSHFLIQRSTDGGKTFATIGRVEGKGDSNERVDYEYVDTKPAPGMNYYRLQQFDFDGTNEFFGPVAVRFGGKADVVIAYPTLAQTELTIEWLEGNNEEAIELSVYDLNGRLMLQRTVAEKVQRTTLPVLGLPQGAYFLRWQRGSENGQIRFVRAQ